MTGVQEKRRLGLDDSEDDAKLLEAAVDETELIGLCDSLII